jgi:hypothetical protein
MTTKTSKITRENMHERHLDIGDDMKRKPVVDLSGWHEGVVESFEQKISAKDTRYYRIGVDLTTESETERFFGPAYPGDNMADFAVAIGLDLDEIGSELIGSLLIGKSVRCRVDFEPGTDDRKARNTIREFAPLT